MHSICFYRVLFLHISHQDHQDTFIWSIICQRGSHATSQTAIYANITQTGRIKVYCGWFWVVLAGFLGGCRWFWVVLAVSMF